MSPSLLSTARAVALARFPFTLIAIASLYGCGGGSSTSGGTPPPPPPPVLTDPGDEPSAVTYNGNAAPASLTEASSSSGRMADRVLASILLTKSLGVDLGPGVANALAGGAGCIGTGTGNLAADGTGWVASEFGNCDTGNGIRWTGKIIYRVRTPRGATPRETSWTFPNMTVVMGGVTYTMAGVVESLETVGAASNLTANFVLQDGSAGPQFKTENFVLNMEPPSTPSFASASGRVYESALGYVDVSTDETFVLANNSTTLQRGGPVRAKGAASSVWISPVTPNLIALELDTAGLSAASKSVLLNALPPFEAQLATQAPAQFGAAAGPTQTLELLQPYRINGRFSGADSHTWVDFLWQLVMAPPGSQVALINAQSPAPTLTPDVPGAYSVVLTSSDGLHVTHDSVSFTVPFPGDSNLPPPSRTSIGPYLGPDIDAPVNSLHLLSVSTAFSTWPPTGNTILYRYGLTGPGAAMPVTAEGFSEADLPTVGLSYTGFYEQSLSINVDSDRVARRYVAHQVPLSHYRPTGFRGLGEGRGLAAGDLSGQGRTDIVSTGYLIAPGGNVRTVGVYRNTAPGRYAAPQYISAGNGGAVVLGDFNSDGRPDIAAEAAYTSIDLIFQQNDGSWSPPQNMQPVGPRCGSDVGLTARPIVAADFNGDGRADLAAVHPCSTGRAIVVFFQNSDGTFSEYDIATSEEPRTLLAADVTGDGAPDLVTVTPPPFTNAPAHVDVYPAAMGNSFGAAITYAIPDSTHFGSYAGATGDYDGDGLTDLVVCSTDGYYLYRQFGAGFTGGARLAPFDKPLWADDFTDKGQFPVTDMRLQDVDGDGRMDVVTRSSLVGAGPISFLLHQQNGSLGPANTVFAPGGTQGAYTLPVFFDANGDGLTDIVYRGSVVPDSGQAGVVFVMRR